MLAGGCLRGLSRDAAAASPLRSRWSPRVSVVPCWVRRRWSVLRGLSLAVVDAGAGAVFGEGHGEAASSCGSGRAVHRTLTMERGSGRTRRRRAPAVAGGGRRCEAPREGSAVLVRRLLASSAGDVGEHRPV